jgi:nickel/cobalt exporter
MLACGAAFAQATHHPFAIGANEGAVGQVGGLGAWIIAQESGFSHAMTQALHAIKAHTSTGWELVVASFAYGVFHAAGPGHGKAVVTSYMVSNERALRRGLIISLLAALLQGFVAVVLICIAALIFHATAQRINAAASMLETMSYVGIVMLGAVLLWRKGAAFLAACSGLARGPVEQIFAANAPLPTSRGGLAFVADDGGQAATLDHMHGPDCGHFHGLDPAKLDKGFVWKGALLTVLTAGARPCSGAILVLVFALAQDMFLIGIGATFVMSLGTAITTGALAAFAVYAKQAAMKYAGPGSPRAIVFGRFVEVAAALCVLLFGLALLTAQWMGYNLSAL